MSQAEESNDDIRDRILVPAVRHFTGVQLTALFFALQSVLMLLASAFADGSFTRIGVLLGAGLYACIAWGLTQARKPAWHLAAFFAFVGIILNLVAIGCAPGRLAEYEITLLDVAGDMLMLVLSVLVWGYLRRAEVREVFGVPIYQADVEN